MTLQVGVGRERSRRRPQGEQNAAGVDLAFTFESNNIWIKPAEAPIIGGELMRIRQEHEGELRPEDVVETARDVGSPLHRYFTWDDSRAADLFRKSQASRLIRSITVRPVGNGIKPVHAFYSIPEEKARVYRALDEVLSEETRLTSVVRKFRGDLRRINAQYSAFRGAAEFMGFEAVFDAIEQALIEREETLD